MEEDLNVSESVAEVENTPEPVESNEPETMFDAISEGLKQDDPVADPAVEDKPAVPEVDPVAEPENEDEPPEGISKKAQERFRSMVTKVKEKDAEIETLRSNLDGIRHIMKDTGAAPEDFGKMFDYMKALNSGDMVRVRAVLEDQIRQYTMLTGQSLSQVDPLAEFPDLRERVNGYQMDENTALEIARNRAIQNRNNQVIQQQNQQQEKTQRYQQARQNAMQEVDQMGAEWAKRDPDYSAKEEIILKQIPVIAKEFPPEQWSKQVRILYQTLSAMPISRPQATTPAPLRASGQSAGTRQPGSMLEALQSGLGYNT